MSSLAALAALAACARVTVIHGHAHTQVAALEDVDLAIAPGERVALYGPSGSGKTTLIHVLAGLIVPTRGTVSWRGRPLSSLDSLARGKARAGGIAIVFQGANLLPTLTAYENVAFAANAVLRTRHAETPPPAARVHKSEELLALVGLEAKLDALPAELSGGEAQRVAIARALAQEPALLLCDEPTGHLDSGTSARVLDLVDALHDRYPFAQVVATHDPDVAARCGRTIVLADGRVASEERA